MRVSMTTLTRSLTWRTAVQSHDSLCVGRRSLQVSKKRENVYTFTGRHRASWKLASASLAYTYSALARTDMSTDQRSLHLSTTVQRNIIIRARYLCRFGFSYISFLKSSTLAFSISAFSCHVFFYCIFTPRIFSDPVATSIREHYTRFARDISY